MAFSSAGILLMKLLNAVRPAQEPAMDTEQRRYNEHVASLRKREFPMLAGTTYLDHAGTTLYSRTLIDAFSQEMMTSLVGNPHSASSSATSTAYRIDNVRSRVLQFFHADPEHFDVVFVANATAAIKLVADAFRDREQGFWFGYHKDSHTSLVGVRELASQGSHCFRSDSEAEQWLLDLKHHDAVQPLGHSLFAYPGQSNMNGRRLPRHWPRLLRTSGRRDAYSLLDAAALVSTSPLDLSDQAAAPDFVCLSFYKIFGFPDLGALIVRKDAAHVFDHRRYFGGGTVEMVACFDEPWHKVKRTSLHSRLEDGTLPVRSILALECALNAHRELFGTMEDVSTHTSWLISSMYERMDKLRHSNGTRVCRMFHGIESTYGDPKTQGATIAFNFCDSHGNWLSNHELNKLASVNQFHIRTGTLCNPGGMADALDISALDLQEYFASGFRCGSESDVRDGKVIGMSRVSLGACSTMDDVDRWINFVKEHYVERLGSDVPIERNGAAPCNAHYVESLTIYPIKSCGGWSVPAGLDWIIRPEGLAWDRQWCLVHQSSRDYLSQKRCPQMALLKPKLDLEANLLHVHFSGVPNEDVPSDIFIPLLFDESRFTIANSSCSTEVCGDNVQPRIYASPDITTFFSSHLGTPCHLAWLPSNTNMLASRKMKDLSSTVDLSLSGESKPIRIGPIHAPSPPPSPRRHPILLANESPILTISRASIHHLNTCTAQKSEPIGPERFRANILISPCYDKRGQPFVEDSWSSMKISRASASRACLYNGNASRTSTVTELAVLGRCRRCQMVCIDQHTGEKCSEPFSTLSKIRRWNGGVWFGIHCGLMNNQKLELHNESSISVGDLVEGIVRQSA